MAEITVTSENFEAEALNADKTVVLDFWAPWCGPCRMLAPILAQVAEERADQIIVGKINVDEELILAQQFRIESIPTIVIMKNGKVTDKHVGFLPKEDLEALL